LPGGAAQWLSDGLLRQASGQAAGRSGWHRRYQQTALTADVFVALVAALAVLTPVWINGVRAQTLATFLLLPAVWMLCLSNNGAYDQWRVGVGPEEYRALMRAAIQLLAVVALATFALDLNLSRRLVAGVVPLVLALTVIERWTLRRRLSRSRKVGQSLQRTVVVGRGIAVADLISEIQSNPTTTGLEVVAACVSDLGDLTDLGTSVAGVPIYGTPEMALLAVDELDAEAAVVLSHPDLAGHGLRRLSWALAERSVDLLVAPGIAEVAAPRLSLQPRAGLSLLHVERPIMSGIKLTVKRATDAVLALMLSVVAVPVMGIIAVLVWREDRGPVFFRQDRVGVQGKTFSMFKFRTMVVDAEARLAAGEFASVEQVNQKLFKQRDDPRVTGVGRVLRRFSLDELPQLINVLRGEMSLVGPRPPLPREVETYEQDEAQRLRVRPGMTGLWQISGRSDLTWEQSLRLDLWYVDNWTPLLDLQILGRTARAVLQARGAY
jgi:exopolysaccharide biosynthesis polyprenyl glycosylphosphotransferase